MDFQVHEEDYAETAFHRKLRHEPIRKRNGDEGYRKEILT
ncbi:hypothetical protein HMPREF1981_00538 [Bacteroides pyogenes F0041]|uniref:Uncharacterized protein n=1 Tax=Bacteroides pyogenes F0041 TaxID=1321819 RepID=U2CD61_9BACE|nr:hypothetical protein HMPREF1981_00538 [Bacteroides pyogenes F0041]